MGYFALDNPHNQKQLNGGVASAILPALCGLPMQYFIEPELVEVLCAFLFVLAFVLGLCVVSVVKVYVTDRTRAENRLYRYFASPPKHKVPNPVGQLLSGRLQHRGGGPRDESVPAGQISGREDRAV